MSGVETSALVPPLAAFPFALLTSVSGVSGAFLLLPFQVGFLHYTSPDVSAIDFVYNIVAIPGGAYLYFREGRMAWPLTWLRITGTLPGTFVGYCVSENTPSAGPQSFQAFFRLCLAVPGVRIHYDPMTDFAQARQGSRTVEDKSETLMTILHPQPYSVVGAALPGTFLTPIAGVLFHRLNPARAGFSKAPGWLLGTPFGARGFLGTCCRARLQRCLPQRMVEALLALIMVSSAGCYVWEFFSQAVNQRCSILESRSCFTLLVFFGKKGQHFRNPVRMLLA